ncbi:hypothetical protein, partial [Methylobacterium sp. GC_Met_2]|uniref:hypothetical protein n=1 Tax=Methylobacterium sp. GC_Met_2 TaxID=2937376 RepID=UPI00226B43D1
MLPAPMLSPAITRFTLLPGMADLSANHFQPLEHYSLAIIRPIFILYDELGLQKGMSMQKFE